MVAGVLFLILKAAAVIVCVLIILTLAILFFALLSKIKYAVNIDGENGFKFNTDVSYLMGIVKIKALYENDDVSLSVKIFGKSLYPREKAEKRPKPKREMPDEKDGLKRAPVQRIEKAEDKKADGSSGKAQPQKRSGPEKSEIKRDKNIYGSDVKKEGSVSRASDNLSWEKRYSSMLERERKNSPQPEIRRIKMSDFASVEAEENKEPKERKDNMSVEPENEESKTNPALKYILGLSFGEKKTVAFGAIRLLKRILGAVLPKKIKAHIRAGVGEPMYTGLLLGALGVLNGIIGGGIRAEGDFDGLSFSGNADFWGCFRPGYILYSLLMFVKIKQVRKAIIIYIKE